MINTISDNIFVVRQGILAAAEEAGRDPNTIRLIGVSKTHPATRVHEALAAQLHDFGENRVQEAEQKIGELSADRAQLCWHLIGHLQSNKAKKAAQLFDYVHSVDSFRLAEALSRQRIALGLAPLKILLQVNVSGEASKEGFDLSQWQQQPQQLHAWLPEVEQILGLAGVQVCGLMTIAPIGSHAAAARPYFASTRALRDWMAARYPEASWQELSMGMTDDFPAAIAEGATMVRVGRAIFGAR